LGSSAADPTINHIRGVDYLGRYLKGTIDSHLVLGGNDKKIKLFGYCDASHLPNVDSKPRLGYCFYLNLVSGTIFARSFFDKTVSHSSCESEIKAADECIRQAVYLRGLLAELGYSQDEPTIIYTDSISAKTLIETFNIGNNSAHLVMRLNYIHEQVANGTIILKYINTENQVADVLTKNLPIRSHTGFTQFLLRGHMGIPPPVSPLNQKKLKLKRIFKISKSGKVNNKKLIHKIKLNSKK
jgi:hypothetical protein